MANIKTLSYLERHLKDRFNLMCIYESTFRVISWGVNNIVGGLQIFQIELIEEKKNSNLAKEKIQEDSQ